MDSFPLTMRQDFTNVSYDFPPPPPRIDRKGTKRGAPYESFRQNKRWKMDKEENASKIGNIIGLMGGFFDEGSSNTISRNTISSIFMDALLRGELPDNNTQDDQTLDSHLPNDSEPINLEQFSYDRSSEFESRTPRRYASRETLNAQRLTDIFSGFFVDEEKS